MGIRLPKEMVFQTKEMTANMTEANNLGYLLHNRPVEVLPFMDRLFSMENIASDNPLMSGLYGNIKKDTITSTEWEWMVKGFDTRPLMVVKNYVPSGETMVKGKEPVQVAFEKNYYVYGDILKPLNAPETVQYRVIRGPETISSGGYLYTLEPVEDSEFKSVPAKFFNVGEYWNKMFSAYGEGADKRGSTTFGGSLAFRNRLSLIAKKYKITDLADLQVLEVKIPDSNGKFHKAWMGYVDVEFYKQWRGEEDKLLWYALSTRSLTDNTGRTVRLGAGVEEQVKDGGFVQYVNNYNHRLFEDYLMNVFYTRSAPGSSNRNVKGLTGEFGLLELNKVGKDMVEKSGFVLSMETITKKAKSAYNSNAYEAGYQITKLNLGNNISLELLHNPAYDDRKLFTAVDPVSGKPAKSLEISFIDFRGKSNPNVVIKDLKNGFGFGYYNGIYGNKGFLKGGQMSHVGAWYEMHIQRYLGVQITDSTATGKLGKNVWITF